MAARKVEDDPFGHIGQADEDPFGHIGAPSSAGQEGLRQGWDVIKQVPSAVVGAAESALTFPANATSFVGGLVDKIPGFPSDPERAAEQQLMRDLLEGSKKPLTRYVPDPETRAGQLTRQG